ncbi:hypothetical protein KSP40_PGU001661 [Platanthera guangdongensis]|uniref:Uncharacterized protein n=1 Tax=Platanthera guangdongensis TaxID=2320717 RepID=A0ABR2M2Z9_9ASPA
MGSNAPGASSSRAKASYSGSKGSNALRFPGDGVGSEEAAEVVSRVQTLRRSKRITNPPARFCEGNTVSSVSCFFTGPLVEREPSNCECTTVVREVENAKDEEVTILRGDEACDLVPKVDGVTPVMFKWVLKLEKKTDGSMTPFGRCWRDPL